LSPIGVLAQGPQASPLIRPDGPQHNKKNTIQQSREEEMVSTAFFRKSWMSCRRLLCGLALAATTAWMSSSPAAAQAQDWPNKPIEIIVGFAPGGGTDLVGRAIATALEKQLKVPVKVINKAGGGGVVGFDLLRSAPPDGYTLGIITAQIITANLRGVMPATYKDFTHVAMINIDQAAIAVPANSPWKTFDDFIKAAKAAPGTISVGNGGEGGSYHMMMRNLENASGIKVKHIPFNGAPAAILQLVGGHIEAAAIGAVEVAPQVKAGAARVLAVAGQAGDPRFPGFPDVPTTAELGVPLQIGTWRAIGMPKGVDPAIVAKLSSAIATAVKDPDFVATMEKLNSPIRYFGPEELVTYIQGQEETYKQIYK
jgi:tripartite-type tricarboxylate transporter receptor subunit TctC